MSKEKERIVSVILSVIAIIPIIICMVNYVIEKKTNPLCYVAIIIFSVISMYFSNRTQK